MFMHFLPLLHELFSLILVMFTVVVKTVFCHNMEAVIAGVKVHPTLGPFKIHTTANAARLLRICLVNVCWKNITVVTTLCDILLL